jgi:serine phosphatase RsbU (regulator of sigma subunit)/anti-sigma regulatory factor (Ser/Thr protein kinase)
VGDAGGNERVVRRVRLPADRRTPASARAVVRSVLDEAKLHSLLDAALLLTTELSTNAVVHAGTDLDLEVAADQYGLTVTVIDAARGVVAAEESGGSNGHRPVARALADLSERGRGLLLVDHFATRWGTTHHDGGKGVWFQLDRADADAAVARGPGLAVAGPPSDRLVADAPALNALLEITPDPYSDDPVGDFAGALLTRLADLVGAGGGVIRCDLGEEGGRTVLARYGRAPRPGAASTLRVPLALGRPASGELVLDAAGTGYSRPLAALVAERVTLALENDRLRRADRRRQTWLTFLAEASELLAQSLDVELTLALIPQLVVPRLGQWSAVHTTDAWGRLKLETAAHADERLLQPLYTTLQETGPDSVQARLPATLRGGGQVALPPPTEGFAIPLIARGQLLGTLSVGRHVHRRHEPDEVAVLQDVARRAALAVDNARIHAERRHVARTLQRSLLPPALPSVPGLGFGAAYVPTGDTADVGGDFYDVVPLRDDRWLVAIGDVSGKGVQAATVTGLVREVIRALARGGRPLPEILERINETLVERGRGRYCTLALASVQMVAGRPDGAARSPVAGAGPDRARLEVSLHLAGHERPVLLRADGRTFAAGSGGTALGLLDTISCPAETVYLDPGDSLIFYTDGVTERRRGRELFGGQRLRDAAAPLSHFSAEVIAARLRTTTIGFSAEPPRDDIALLVLRNELAIPPVRARARVPTAPVPSIKESA